MDVVLLRDPQTTSILSSFVKSSTNSPGQDAMLEGILTYRLAKQSLHFSVAESEHNVFDIIRLTRV